MSVATALWDIDVAMSYEDYRSRFGDVQNQYNVMALVGNGFDIQALTGLGSPTDTRYESFYGSSDIRWG